MLQGKKIIVGVTGGIAAYKAADLVSRLMKNHASVTVIMTPAAAQFVTPLTFSTLSANDVYGEMFAPFAHTPQHIALAERGELIVVAPLTANTLAKFAHGIADTLLTATLLAAKRNLPILFAPAMNTRMWENPATRENLDRAKNRGVEIIPPISGRLACGEIGDGKMASPETIFNAVASRLTR